MRDLVSEVEKEGHIADISPTGCLRSVFEFIGIGYVVRLRRMPVEYEISVIRHAVRRNLPPNTESRCPGEHGQSGAMLRGITLRNRGGEAANRTVEKSRMRRRGTRDMWQRKKASELPHPFEDRRALEIRSDHPRIVNGIGE